MNCQVLSQEEIIKAKLRLIAIEVEATNRLRLESVKGDLWGFQTGK